MVRKGDDGGGIEPFSVFLDILAPPPPPPVHSSTVGCLKAIRKGSSLRLEPLETVRGFSADRLIDLNRFCQPRARRHRQAVRFPRIDPGQAASALVVIIKFNKEP